MRNAKIVWVLVLHAHIVAIVYLFGSWSHRLWKDKVLNSLLTKFHWNRCWPRTAKNRWPLAWGHDKCWEHILFWLMTSSLSKILKKVKACLEISVQAFILTLNHQNQLSRFFNRPPNTQVVMSHLVTWLNIHNLISQNLSPNTYPITPFKNFAIYPPMHMQENGAASHEVFAALAIENAFFSSFTVGIVTKMSI